MADPKKVIEKITGKAPSGKNAGPLSSYKMTYQSDVNQLEPVYYWLLDFMQDAGIAVEKIVDNFSASPGSGQFSEMGQKATKMQEEGMKILGAINQVIKSIVQLLYDLKEFEMRLKNYELANKAKDPKEKEAAVMGLKNIWLDQVDLKRGQGSIHQMTQALGYTTLRDAFIAANTLEDIKNMAGKEGVINDTVRRVLEPRLQEFLTWRELSEKEITKRFEIQKAYLKSQVETMKLYTKWASPYLKAAEELRMKGFDTNAALVSAFSTSMFELVLLGLKETKIDKNPVLKKKFGDYKLKRKYFSCYLISMKYRGHLAQRATQKGDMAFGFGGRVDMNFDCYAFNSEELELIKKGIADADVNEGLKFLQENTQTSLEQMREDIEHFLQDDKKKEYEIESKKQDNTNPFTALFGLFSVFKIEKKDEKKTEIKKPEEIKKDNFVEEDVRKSAADAAKGFLYVIYDVYKKAHGMASSPENFDN
jgi:hypothetical protein